MFESAFIVSSVGVCHEVTAFFQALREDSANERAETQR